MAGHADRVWTAVSQSNGHAEHVLSWRRCVRLHGLAPERRGGVQQLGARELGAAREETAGLITAASQHLDRLSQVFVRAGACLALSDARGVVLERRSSDGDARDFLDLGLCEGADWGEAAMGTNGIGTALAEERAVAIHRDKHFLPANTRLSCATAPIRDHRARIAGSLDISSCRYDTNEAILGVFLLAAQEAASQIEADMFRAAFPGARLVLAPGRAGPQGLLAVDGDDVVIGANHAARRALGLDDAALAAPRSVQEVLGEGDEGPVPGFEAAERRTLRLALAQSGGNVSAAATRLGVSRATLHRKLKRFDLR